MHEIGIASQILQEVEVQAARRSEVRVTGVGLRIGELSNIDRDALAFAFDALTRDTRWEGLKVEMEWFPRRQKCLNCGHEFQVENLQLDCPVCHSVATSCVSGTELDIAYLEVEEVADQCVKP